MGKGDKKSKRGKIILGSYGVRRPRRPKALTPAKKEKVEKIKVEKVKPIKLKEDLAELIPQTIVAEVDLIAETKPAVAEKKVAPSKKATEETHAEPAKTSPAKAPKEPVENEKKTTKPKPPRKETAKPAKSAG
jgi:ribosomal small subunit protein bTHX